MATENGRAALGEAIDELYHQARIYNDARAKAKKQAKVDKSEVANVGPYPVHGIKADVGIGKSGVSMAHVANLISTMRAAKDKTYRRHRDPSPQTWR
jgi:hypothetical protein